MAPTEAPPLLAAIVVAAACALAALLSAAAALAASRRRGPEALLAQRLELLSRSVERLEDELRRELRDSRREGAEQVERIRRTVDEQLQGALERKLSESFGVVSARLEEVHRGLGEMQSLATGVGDLRRVLTNVKTRGGWGEVQLGALLSQLLAPGQYAANVRPKKGSNDVVEFALRLPGRDEAGGEVLLPIDAKFPVEDWLRLVEASERGDAAGVEAAAKDLDRRLREEARSIAEKYLDPPATTDFAILFLPTEGLYAEAVRRPGLAEELQGRWRVTVAGPSTLAALLTSLQMGFRTLAIERRSAEAWRVLGTVKAEMAQFGAVLERVRKKLQEASNVVEEADVRTRAVGKSLRDVEGTPLPGPPDRG